MCDNYRYPQEDVGQIPMAFVVRQPGSNLSEWQVMDYVAKQVYVSVMNMKKKSYLTIFF